MDVLKDLKPVRKRPTGYITDRWVPLYDHLIASLLSDFNSRVDRLIELTGLSEDDIKAWEAGPHLIRAVEDMPEEFLPAIVRGRSVVELALKAGQRSAEVDAAIEKIWELMEYMQYGDDEH